MTTVAIVGAGPAGIALARFLLSEGLEPTLYEATDRLGGQWSGNPAISGVWPSLCTNTSRTLTAFSDLPPDDGVVYPSNGELQAYLERYARRFGVYERIRFETPVTHVAQADDGRWTIETADGVETYDRLAIASGRFNHPQIPHVPGVETFSGSAGVLSTFDYGDPERYRGKRVLVGGCAVSALEIASDLAMLGAARVVVTQRRQRYVLPKLAQGVPSDHIIFNRYGVLAADALPADEVGRQLKEIVVEAGGTPQQYGAPPADDDFFKAGVTLSQHHLPLVAEGRIAVKPWMTEIDGQTVRFPDGTEEAFDGILFGTGFTLHIPFLDQAIRDAIDIDDLHMDLYRYTFTPDLPGLAFLGMWDQSGGYLVPIEQQARWVAYTWSGAIPAPDETAMRAFIDDYRARRGQSQKTRMNLAAVMFAREAGVEPDVAKHPELARALLFGPLAPVQFRLDGHDPLPDAAERFAADAARHGAIGAPELTERERAYVALVADATGDASLRALTEPREPAST